MAQGKLLFLDMPNFMTAARAVLIILFVILFWPSQGKGCTVLAIRSKDTVPYNHAITGFRSGFQGLELNLVIIDTTEEETEISSILSKYRPDLILCLGTKALKYALTVKKIPKIFCLVLHPEMYLSTDYLDVYGITIELPPLLQFRIIAQAFPRLKRIGVIYNPEFNQKYIEIAKESAKSVALDLVTCSVRSVKEVPSALHHLEDKIDILWSILDNTAYGPETARYVLLFALRRDIPFVGFSPQFAKAGALMAVYGDYEDMGRQSALLAKKVLLGNEESLVKILQPRKARIAINQKVARALGITFTPEFLKIVDKVF